MTSGRQFLAPGESERTFLVSAMITPFGALIGMVTFRHKGRNLKFVLLIPALTALHGLFIGLILIRL